MEEKVLVLMDRFQNLIDRYDSLQDSVATLIQYASDKECAFPTAEACLQSGIRFASDIESHMIFIQRFYNDQYVANGPASIDVQSLNGALDLFEELLNTGSKMVTFCTNELNAITR